MKLKDFIRELQYIERIYEPENPDIKGFIKRGDYLDVMVSSSGRRIESFELYIDSVPIIDLARKDLGDDHRNVRADKE